MTYEDTFDAVIEGAGAERGAKVVAARDGLYVNDHEVPYETLLGVALRGSILLVVGTQVAMALRGTRDGLATLAAELRRHADLNHLAASDREVFEGEKVIFSTPVAMSGQVDIERVKGMPLVVVTDDALHVLDRGGRQVRIPWGRLARMDTAEAKFGRLLRIGSGTTEMELLYLTDAQIQTIRGLASREGSWLMTGEGRSSTPTGQAEAPAKGPEPAAPSRPEPTGPTPEASADPLRQFSVPEFELSLGGVGIGSDRPLGAVLDRLEMSPVLPVGFLEEHLREMQTVFNGVLLKRKREAAAAEELPDAARALNGKRLQANVKDGIGVITDALVRGFERQARRIAANRRIPWRRARSKYMPKEKEMIGLRQRLQRAATRLEPALETVTDAAGRLQDAATEGGDALEAAYTEWLQGLRELDQAYAATWEKVGREIVGVWQDIFLPRLTRLAGERRRLLPWPVRAALYFLVLVLIGAGVYLYFTGRLDSLLSFL